MIGAQPNRRYPSQQGNATGADPEPVAQLWVRSGPVASQRLDLGWEETPGLLGRTLKAVE